MKTNRRTFSRAILGGLAAGGLSAQWSAKAAEHVSDFDRFGGWTARRFGATGFFRTEHDGRRWWLVTPEGHAFLSFGINHLYPDLFRQKFNHEAWTKNLGGADLSNWSQFAPALRKWFLATCRDYGFNTVGVHNALQIVNQPQPALPYMRPIRFVDIPHWKMDVTDASFRDVFSQEFARHCDALAREAAVPGDPFLIGYSMTDCPLLTEEDCRERTDVIGGARRRSRIGWPRRLRNLGASAAGKHAWVRTMQEIYRGVIANFNATYATSFDSFDALAAASNWRPDTDRSNGNETRDNIEFLKRVVEKYYQVTRDAIRRYDRNHLFFGDKLNANTDSIDTVLRITSRYTDVVMYQMYARYEVQQPGLDRWSKIANKPFVNGDSAFTMIAPHMPRPYGPVADSLEQRTEWTDEFFRRSFARPEFVGWHYCGLIDATQQVARKQARQHSGLMTAFGQPYPILQQVIRRCVDDMYQLASQPA